MNLDELNELVDSGEMDEFIRVCEARQIKALSKIADQIVEQENRRVILVAGCSSAGKTTAAKRLCTQLRVNERAAIHLSTDDYFVGDAANPRDENGELDYETVACVNQVRLVEDIQGLLAGRAVALRRFDFSVHEGYDAHTTTKLPPQGIVVLEGIHALNPILTEGLEKTSQFSLFVDPATQPEIFVSTRLKPEHARLIRRIVRDNQFRRLSPQKTFELWPKVLAGEQKWILPFRAQANVEFDSSLAYELAVIKPYVAGLLEHVLKRDPENMLAHILSDILQLVRSAPPLAVPGDSILRETIGGSQLMY